MIDYKLEILLNLIKLLLPFLLITSVSYFFARILKITNLLEKVLFIFLFNWFQIIILIELLSLFNAVTPWNLLIFYSISFLFCLFFYFKNRLKIRFNFFDLKRFLVSFYYSLGISRILKIIIIFWFIVIIFVTLFIGLIAPPGNYDSMTYHLARAGFWKQYQSINDYETSFIHQNDYPRNAEIGLLWIILFTNSDSLTFLIQWSCFIIVLICLYRILRTLDYSPAISFVTVFVFSTFDLVIFEATSTQNDMVVACFITLALYFLIKTLKADKTNLTYIFLSGFAAALAIGTKTYAVLFIPGFFVFMLLYGKIRKEKFLKILYLASFFILGCILFASYTWIQNYINYANIFSDPEVIPLFSIEDPGFRTSISNLSRHISLFYQYKSVDYGIVSVPMERIIGSIHNIINLDKSSPVTTFGAEGFLLSDWRLNYDESSFGPICFFLVLPSVVLNLILFTILKGFNKNRGLDTKFKNSLKVLIIPACFFISYIVIFKWTYLANRYMIAFIALLMISFAESLELLSKIKWRYFYKTIVFIIVLLALFSSIFPLFRNDYYNITGFTGDSIFRVDYDERRGTKSGTGRIAVMNRTKDMLDETIGLNSDLGLILNDGDWVFIFFGEDFKRNLQYISEDEWNNSSIEELLKNRNLDGLLVNRDETDKNNSRGLDPIVSKLIGKSLLKIDREVFAEYFSPLKACEFIDESDGVLIRALGDDPHFETTFQIDFNNTEKVVMVVTIVVPVATTFQVFFDTSSSTYNEQNSKRYDLIQGENEVYIDISDVGEINKIRIDPSNTKIDSLIKSIEFFSVRDDFKYKNEGNYILFIK